MTWKIYKYVSRGYWPDICLMETVDLKRGFAGSGRISPPAPHPPTHPTQLVFKSHSLCVLLVVTWCIQYSNNILQYPIAFYII